MKNAAMITLATMLGTGDWGATKDEAVVVCIEAGNHVAQVSAAGMTASQLFKSAGVKLDWHTGLRYCQTHRVQAILVTLSTDTPKTFRPEALAYALPYEGVHIQLFYDRISRSDPQLLPSLMAYVVVHEVTHILQNIDRHSPSGIMKALWDPSDYAQMKRVQLRFTESDIEIIRAGLAKRASGGPLATAVAR